MADRNTRNRPGGRVAMRPAPWLDLTPWRFLGGLLAMAGLLSLLVVCGGC